MRMRFKAKPPSPPPQEVVEMLRKMAMPGYERAFEEANTILCIQAHPDDMDCIAGGTIAQLSQAGKEVIYVTVTDGCMGTSDPELMPEKLASIRRAEQEEAARTLGVRKLIWLDYKDSELQPTLELRNKLIRIIRETRPDLVITLDPWLPYEAHPDHRYTGLMATEAALFSGFPHVNPKDLRDGLKPHSPRYVAFCFTSLPNLYVDITDTLELKLKAVRAHKSQFGDGEEITRALELLAEITGRCAGFRYAEAFKVMNGRTLHAFVLSEWI